MGEMASLVGKLSQANLFYFRHVFVAHGACVVDKCGFKLRGREDV